ncbi:MAG TPA: hypothetical protein VFU06_07240 [Longimicrobiales bacterium]|nr:hypothetical protein [Longimicrobiales bacterium]
MVNEQALAIARELERDFGSNLKSVLLFGSVARGEHIDGVSNINLLVLLDDLNAALLERAVFHAKRWRETGAVPLLLEAHEWQRAADVFAIEIADMHDAHEVLAGEDPVTQHAVDRGALRTQAEHELRGKVMQLRSGLLAAAGEPELIGGLLMATLPSLATYLRAALRLAGETVPGHMEDVIAAGTRLVGARPDALLAAHRARVGRSTLRLRLTDELVESYHHAAERTAAYVDAFKE